MYISYEYVEESCNRGGGRLCEDEEARVSLGSDRSVSGGQACLEHFVQAGLRLKPNQII